jgi:cell division protein FtsL
VRLCFALLCSPNKQKTKKNKKQKTKRVSRKRNGFSKVRLLVGFVVVLFVCVGLVASLLFSIRSLFQSAFNRQQ